ncbi:MAG: hypothetical protein LCH81_14245 [Bacteroidetes bacterium]|nr:hypothetical protein [Bacteroidota bacterium]
MKLQLKFILPLGLASILAFPAWAQDSTEADSTGLAGDNFSLEAALDLFKQSASLEDFEKRLNEEDNPANNLDLNDDGKIDYIRVVDEMDGDVHAIVLQTPVSESESQDIAVIEIEKTGAESAILQIVGDEDVFGEQVLVEPSDEEVDAPKGRGGPAVHLAPDAIVVNVWLWSPVRFIYRPAYVVYVSPWRWGYYPGWWQPFRPRPWRVFYPRFRPYHVHYHVVTTHRVVHAHRVYTPHRRHSTVVHTRTTTHVATNGRGRYSKTTKTTTVNGRNGRSIEHEKTSTTVNGRKGRSVEREQSSTTVNGRNGGKAHKEKSSTTVNGRNGGEKVKREKSSTKARGGGGNGGGGRRGRN